MATRGHAGVVGQALEGLQKLGPRAGLQDAGELRTAALALAAEGASHGLSRIDGVLPANDGRGYFLVEGGNTDPAHKRVFVDGAQLLSQPAEQRAAQLAQATTAQPALTPDAQPSPQRAALA